MMISKRGGVSANGLLTPTRKPTTITKEGDK